MGHDCTLLKYSRLLESMYLVTLYCNMKICNHIPPLSLFSLRIEVPVVAPA